MNRIANLFAEAYAPLLRTFRLRTAQYRVASLSLTASQFLRENGLKLWLSNEASGNYARMVEPGLVYLDLMGDMPEPDEMTKREEADLRKEVDKLQPRIEQIDASLDILRTEREQLVSQREFWLTERARFDRFLKDIDKFRGGRWPYILIHNYKTGPDRRVLFDGRGQALVSNSKRIQPSNRTEAKEVRQGVVEVLRGIIGPEQKRLSKRLVGLESEEKALLDNRKALQDNQEIYEEMLDELGLGNVDEDLAKKEEVRFAEYWREFLGYLKNSRGTHSFSGRGVAMLKNTPVPIYKYKRGRLRIFFRPTGVPGYYHIWNITLRDSQTYKDVTGPLAESNRLIQESELERQRQEAQP